MTRAKMSFRTVRNPVWMLRFAQHDKGENVIPNASEESSMDASLALSMTRAKMSFRTPVRNPVWMLRFAQHDKGENVIPNASEESSMDASLRSA
jgi:hypothetical protein